MFARDFAIATKLHFIAQPKLYIILKLCIVLCIVVHRAFVIMQDPHEDRIWKFILQILALPLLLTFEYLLFCIFSKKKVHKAIEISFMLLTQIGFSELFIELSMLVFAVGQRNSDEIFFQETIFLNALMTVFTDNKIIKGCLTLYIAIVSAIRLSLFENKLYYIHWSFMAFIFSLSVILTFKKEKPTLPVKIHNNQSRYSKLENVTEGVALIQKDKSILYMNGLFKGLFESMTDIEALGKVLKLKKLDPSTTSIFPKPSDIKIRPVTTNTPRLKSSFDFNNINLKTDHPSSLEAPKVGSLAYGGSLLSPRPSIFNHRSSILPRPSLLQGPPSILLRRTSNLHSVSSRNLDVPPPLGPLPLPVIKINMSKVKDEDSRPGWLGNESDTRSPLMKGPPEQNCAVESSALNSAVRELRLTSRSNFVGSANYVDTYNPEHLALRSESQEKALDISETVEGAIDQMFTSMDGRQNLVITQLIENMPFPLEILKGKPPSSPLSTRYESAGLGNSTVERFHVMLKDTLRGQRIFEMILSPFMYLKKETMCISIRDITYEVKSDELNDILEAKNKALRFVSHEFRTPLNCSISLLDVMKKFVSREICSKYLLPALNSSKMLLSLANDILDHAMIQAKKLRINIMPCRVKRVLEEVIEMMNIQALAKNIELKLDWDPKVPQKFYTDPNRLRQIILNLVSNALKYTVKGCITLQGRYDSPTTCKLAVIDTGVGISQKNLEILFQEFGKLQENKHLNPRGVGLGLVIAKLLSQELGYDSEGLTVESEEGRGSNFHFVLESKAETHAEEAEDSDLDESLDENSGNPFIIRTTNREWEDIAPKMQSAQIKSRRKKRSITKLLIQESRAQSPSHQYHKQESAKGNFLNFPFSKTVENLESVVPVSSKKKSSDVEMHHRMSIFPTVRDFFGKRRIYQRSFTLENIAGSNLGDFDTEFAQFLKRAKHNCSAPKALLVDDSIFNLTALQALLSYRLGIESVTALTGQEAIDQVMKNERKCKKCKNFKVIFMDVEMPEMNGFEATQKLKGKMLEGEISFIPIIGVTGHNPNEKRVQCLTSGMNDMVAKPVSEQLLKELIVRWMHP